MSARELAEKICRVLREAGHQAYFVGGCVRDLLLQRPTADYDVATDATPDRVQQLFSDSLAVGAQFGVILVVDGSTLTANSSYSVALAGNAQGNVRAVNLVNAAGSVVANSVNVSRTPTVGPNLNLSQVNTIVQRR